VGLAAADTCTSRRASTTTSAFARRLGIATAWIERRHGMKGSGGTLESEHTEPDYHFRTLAELADAVDAGR
jgi:putative hydrolase of the HAD superfamily